MPETETNDVRLARIEERVGSHQTLIQMLADDIAKTKDLIASVEEKGNMRLERLETKIDSRFESFETKMDNAIDTSRRSLPKWADVVMIILISALSILGTVFVYRP